jgi:hypothetical protein
LKYVSSRQGTAKPLPGGLARKTSSASRTSYGPFTDLIGANLSAAFCTHTHTDSVRKRDHATMFQHRTLLRGLRMRCNRIESKPPRFPGRRVCLPRPRLTDVSTGSHFWKRRLPGKQSNQIKGLCISKFRQPVPPQAGPSYKTETKMRRCTAAQDGRIAQTRMHTRFSVGWHTPC